MPTPQVHTRPLRRVYGEIHERARAQVARWRGKKFSWKKALQVAVIFFGACFIFGTALVLWVSRDLPDPNHLSDAQIAQSTKIYDRTGKHLLYEVYQDQKRTIINMDQISPFIVHATVAVEDKEFYTHSGIRVVSIIRAGVSDVINRLLRLVGIRRTTGSGGGSTLTQQLVKNTIVGNSRSLIRKVKEAILAIQLEKRYSKDDILKLYLNQIPYGSTNYGVESAAQSYFHKSAKDVTLAEAATIAGMVQSPSRYLNHLDQLQQRRNVVLKLMFEQGYITEDQKKAAQAEPLHMYINNGILAAPHFVLYVKQQLADQFGEKLVDTGGLKVITTLDYDKQQQAEKIVKENGDKFAKESHANNAAMVAIDPKTGQIISMVGSRDFFNEEIDGQFNVITSAKLQPGSSLKPFVYTAAFEKGFTPDTVLYDVQTSFDSKYHPHDYDGKERGLLTMRKALQGSLNIPAVKTLYLVGLNNMMQFAQRFGYTTLTDRCQLTMVLGGCEVNPLEHTNAYATLADNGVYHAPVSILQVTDPNGNSLFQWQPNEGTVAIKPELAATISNVLSDNDARAYMFGAVNNLTLPDRKVAAKTGTTNDTKAVWTMGYVPSLAVGVWVGNSDNSPMTGTSNKLAAVVWNQFMRAALASTTPESFPVPPANDATKPVLRGTDNGIKLSVDTLTGKIATSSTPPNLIVEKLFLPPHDILFYVDKDDPRGPAPANPGNDPQYDRWEAGLQDWVRRMNEAGTPVSLEEPPTEYDSSASVAPEQMPTVQINSPMNGAILNSRSLNFQINAAAPRGVKQVVYYIDGAQVASSNQYPFGTTYYAKFLEKGQHTLRVYAVDDIGNTGITESTFDLEAEFDPPDFEWFSGNMLTVTAQNFPNPVYIQPFRWDAAQKLEIYLEGGGQSKLIYTFTPASDKLINSQLLTFTWQHFPGVGSHTLRGILTDGNGRTVEKDLIVTAN